MPEVGVSQLRRHLKDWLERARAGEEIIVTDRGTPVARLVGADSTQVLERLVEKGVIAPPADASRPHARGEDRVAADDTVSGLIVDERDTRR